MMEELKPSIPEGAEAKKVYYEEVLILDVTQEIYRLMEEAGVSKADLARTLGVSKSNITQQLRGSTNMSLRRVADVLLALGAQLEVKAVPLAAVKAEDAVPEKEAWSEGPREAGEATLSLHDQLSLCEKTGNLTPMAA